jgi:hypothetical protein
MKRLTARRPSPASLLACIALIAALAGTAYAAKKIGTNQLKNGAVTTKKLKNRAVTSAKLKGGAVTSDKLADGAVTSGKLAGGAVTAANLVPEERSEGFEATTLQSLALAAGSGTVVQSLALPPGGHYVIVGSATLGNNAASANSVSCDLRDDGAPLAEGIESLDPLATFSETITLTGVSDGGQAEIACRPENAAMARSRVITAVRVGSLQAQ